MVSYSSHTNYEFYVMNISYTSYQCYKKVLQKSVDNVTYEESFPTSNLVNFSFFNMVKLLQFKL